jgi:hypothetical protein
MQMATPKILEAKRHHLKAPSTTTTKAKKIFVDAGEPAPEDFELEELSFLRCSSTGNRTLVSRDLS